MNNISPISQNNGKWKWAQDPPFIYPCCITVYGERKDPNKFLNLGLYRNDKKNQLMEIIWFNFPHYWQVEKEFLLTSNELKGRISYYHEKSKSI